MMILEQNVDLNESAEDGQWSWHDSEDDDYDGLSEEDNDDDHEDDSDNDDQEDNSWEYYDDDDDECGLSGLKIRWEERLVAECARNHGCSRRT